MSRYMGRNTDLTVQMFFTLLPLILGGFIFAMYLMITLTNIEYGGVNKLTPDYFEVYNHCPELKEKTDE